LSLPETHCRCNDAFCRYSFQLGFPENFWNHLHVSDLNPTVFDRPHDPFYRYYLEARVPENQLSFCRYSPQRGFPENPAMTHDEGYDLLVYDAGSDQLHSDENVDFLVVVFWPGETFAQVTHRNDEKDGDPNARSDPSPIPKNAAPPLHDGDEWSHDDCGMLEMNLDQVTSEAENRTPCPLRNPTSFKKRDEEKKLGKKLN
jgi:hypothetical protein